MSDKSDPLSPQPSSPPQSFEQAAERVFWHRLWDMKKLTLWLAGPSAVLVFLNQLMPFWSMVRPGGDKGTQVIVEHRMAADPAVEDPKLPPLVVEGTRFDDASPQTLEFICRNQLQHPIFVQKATVEVLRVWKLQPAERSRGLLARSAEYDLLLPADGEPARLEKALSQEIAANGFDRFALKLGLAPSQDASTRVFSLRVSLSCGSQIVSAGNFLYLISAASGSNPPPASMNRSAIAEIMATSGTRNPPLEKLLASGAP